jgi:hypothetical protein
MVIDIFWGSVCPHTCWFHPSDHDDAEKAKLNYGRAR